MKGGEKGCHCMECCGCSCGMGMHGMHGHHPHSRIIWGAFRVLIGLLILIGIFCAGFAAGRATGYMSGSYGRAGSVMMFRSGTVDGSGMMGGNRNWIYASPSVEQVVPVTPTAPVGE